MRSARGVSAEKTWGCPRSLPTCQAVLAIVLGLTLTCSAASVPGAETGIQTHSYSMKARVKLLFFWVGKDQVGGGSIRLLRRPPDASCRSLEGVEVLFGSDPKRVPGGINRWGCGREWACWKTDASGSSRLEFTRFEGFMRHSREESLGQVRASHSREKTDSLYWYDGIESTVTAQRAQSEVRMFSQKEDFDFRNSESAWKAYESRRHEGEPDRKRSFDNARHYDLPFGFLTGVLELMREVCQRFHQSPSSWMQTRYELSYAYHAKPYFLSIRGLRHKTRFVAPALASNSLSSAEFSDVVEADFRVTEKAGERPHDFVLWFPVRGPYAAVPLKILDQPRWWLQVELNLVSSTPTEGELTPQSHLQRSD